VFAQWCAEHRKEVSKMTKIEILEAKLEEKHKKMLRAMLENNQMRTTLEAVKAFLESKDLSTEFDEFLEEWSLF
jgi:hypothetical protein